MKLSEKLMDFCGIWSDHSYSFVQEAVVLEDVIKAAQEYRQAVLDNGTYSCEEVMVLFNALERVQDDYTRNGTTPRRRLRN